MRRRRDRRGRYLANRWKKRKNGIRRVNEGERESVVEEETMLMAAILPDLTPTPCEGNGVASKRRRPDEISGSRPNKRTNKTAPSASTAAASTSETRTDVSAATASTSETPVDVSTTPCKETIDISEEIEAGDDELVLISKRRLREVCGRRSSREETGTTSEEAETEEDRLVLMSRNQLGEISGGRLPGCECDEDYRVEFVDDALETKVTRSCPGCLAEATSAPARCRPSRRGNSGARLFRTTAAIIYHSILEDFGPGGIKQLQSAMGLTSIGQYKFNKYAKYLYERMEEHFKAEQEDVYEKIRKYYLEEFNLHPDENGILNIDVSYDSTLRVKARESIGGMGVVIEVHTGYVVDIEVVSALCWPCANQQGLLKSEKITDEDYNVWRTLHDDECDMNYEGPLEGMEEEAARRLFLRSEDIGFRYNSCADDGNGDLWTDMWRGATSTKILSYSRILFVARAWVLYHNSVSNGGPMGTSLPGVLLD